MSLTSHYSLLLTSSYLGYGSCSSPIRSGLCLPRTDTWNTWWTQCMERGSIGLWVDIDIYWQTRKIHSRLWSNFLLVCVVDKFLMFSQTSLRAFHHGVSLMPLDYYLFSDSCASWRCSLSLDWSSLICFSQRFMVGMHFLDNMILLYVGLYLWFTFHKNTQMETCFLFCTRTQLLEVGCLSHPGGTK